MTTTPSTCLTAHDQATSDWWRSKVCITSVDTYRCIVYGLCRMTPKQELENFIKEMDKANRLRLFTITVEKTFAIGIKWSGVELSDTLHLHRYVAIIIGPLVLKINWKTKL